MTNDYELAERVALLKKLRSLLSSQRDKFKQYLIVLERQEEDILAKDVDKLEARVDLEQSIAKDIFAFQKVVDPLREIYRMAYPLREQEIPELETSLDHLREQVLQRNKRNQELLKDRMVDLRREIADIRSRRTRRPSFAGRPEPSLIDITT